MTGTVICRVLPGEGCLILREATLRRDLGDSQELDDPTGSTVNRYIEDVDFWRTTVGFPIGDKQKCLAGPGVKSSLSASPLLTAQHGPHPHTRTPTVVRLKVTARLTAADLG